MKCECGKILRYQYIAKNYKNGEIKHFGEKHFQEHTGIPANIVKEIIKGFNRIDYELDEILLKVREGWNLNLIIPDEITLPKDIQEHLKLNLPLLSRQEKRLYKLLEEHNEQTILAKIGSKERQYQTPSDVFIQELAATKSSEMQLKSSQKKKAMFQLSFIEKQGLTDQQKNIIHQMLNDGVNSTRFICEQLVENDPRLNLRYPTGKPKIYLSVVMYLDELVRCDKIEFIDKDGFKDRFYRSVYVL